MERLAVGDDAGSPAWALKKVLPDALWLAGFIGSDEDCSLVMPSEQGCVMLTDKQPCSNFVDMARSGWMAEALPLSCVVLN